MMGPTEHTIPTLLRELASEVAERVAIVFQEREDETPITYEQLIERSAVYSRTLENAEIAVGEPVIIILEHSIDLIFAFFGAILHGALPAIMPFLTEKLSPERYRESLASLISITKPSAIITYRDFQPEIEALHAPDSSVQAIIYADDLPPKVSWDWGALAGLQREPHDLVLLQHSSGTTGLQKGVALSHRAVLNQLQAYSSALELDADDVVVSWLPLYHDMGLIAGFILPVLMRVKLVLMSPFDWVRAPFRLMRSVSEHEGTLTWLPNFAYNFCAKKIRDDDLENVDLSSWRAVINCSEPMRHDSHEMFLERFKPYGLSLSALATCYAMAENVFAVTQGGIHEPIHVDPVSRESLTKHEHALPAEKGEDVIHMLSAGPPIANTSVQIIDEGGQALPDRAIGEIVLKGDSLLSEYYRRPDITKEAFVDGWYKTGDLGYMLEGDLFITGRAKELIIVGGKNVYPQDLEALVYAVPGVYPGRAVAFGVDNPDLGTEDVAIVAEFDKSAASDAQSVAKGIRAAIAEGSDVTARYIQVVDRGWLIKTSSGKNARTANKDKYLREFAHWAQR